MGALNIGPALMRAMLSAVAETIIAKRDDLCKIDSYIGDGDHGIGMGHGFTAARDQLAALPEEAGLAKVMRTFGMGVVTGAGGASGPLFGAVFIEGGKVAQAGELTEFTAAEVARWWRAALNYIQSKGGAQPGDKTMVDALWPAVEAMEAAAGEGDITAMFEAAARAAWEGVEKTKAYVAGQGRSRYLGERAVGHQDAGATSIAIILDVCREQVA